MLITLVCALCRLFVGVAGWPYCPESIFEAARGLGWSVEGRRIYCPRCRAKGSET